MHSRDLTASVQVFVEQHDQGKEHMSYPQLCVGSCPIQVCGELLIDQNMYSMEGEHESGRLGRPKIAILCEETCRARNITNTKTAVLQC